jgi:hypothetical protein
MISVIVLTLWVNPEITISLIQSLQESKYIDQIILIENKVLNQDLNFSKLERHQQEENIYVNPAWNLGVMLSKNNKLLIINDDIHFDDNLVKLALPYISPENGMIGIKTYEGSPTDKKEMAKINTSLFHQPYYGSLFFIHKDSYNFIPENIKIFCGDLYLYYLSLKQNWIITGFYYNREGSLTTNKEIFNFIKLEDIKKWTIIKDNFFNKQILDLNVSEGDIIELDNFTLNNNDKIIYYHFTGYKYLLFKFIHNNEELISDIIDGEFYDTYGFKNILNKNEYNIKIFGY